MFLLHDRVRGPIGADDADARLQYLEGMRELDVAIEAAALAEACVRRGWVQPDPSTSGLGRSSKHCRRWTMKPG